MSTHADTPKTVHRPVPSNPEYGLLAWLENTRISLPLKGIECRFETAGDVAHVEVDQIYHQTAPVPLDCTYVFPLPAGAAVHRCEFHVNGRVIRARIEEAGQARQEYETARAAGRRAALVESNRPNLFTLSLANVQPQDLVVVRLAYVQTLELLGEERRLRIPTCPGIRYIPGRPLLRPNGGPGVADDTDQVPDASRISPPRIPATDPDAAYLTVSGTVGLVPADFDRFQTRSHAIRSEATPGFQRVSLDSESAVPDQDFLLGWTLRVARTLTPRAWTTRDRDHDYALLELRAPEGVPRAARRPLDVYFLLDGSGSMSGPKWTQACTALHELLKPLGHEDRIQVSCFSDTEEPLNSSPMPVREFQRDWSLGRILGSASGGGTELLPALNGTLRRVLQFSRERQTALILLTDGQVGNEQAILEALRPFPHLVVHTFGIDTVVNDAVLASLARRQRGRCVLLRPEEDIPAALRRLGTLLSSPVLTSLQLSPEWEPADGPLADLYEGQASTGLVRGRPGAALELTGVLPDGTRTAVPLTRHDAPGATVPLLWARRRIQDLEGRGESVECVALSKEFNLLCQHTAFIAWDEQEQVAIANRTIQQPSLNPALWQLGTPTLGLAEFLRPSESGLLHRIESPDRRYRRSVESLGLTCDEPDPVEEFEAVIHSLPFQREPGFQNLMELMRLWACGPSPEDAFVRIRQIRRLVLEILEDHQGSPGRQIAALARRFTELLEADAAGHADLRTLCAKHGW